MSLKVLVLSRNYPNNIMPLLGLWVEQLVQHTLGLCEPRVIAPVPYWPPLPGFADYARFRQVPAHEQAKGVEILHPRFVTGPGYWLHSYEASTYYRGIYRHVDRLRGDFPFDLIHAHFSYPDGVVAARLGRRYGVPVIITEHAPWRPWMDDYPRVRRQAVWAAQTCAFHLPVSRSVRKTIVHFTGESDRLRVVPVGVDGSVFTPLPDGRHPKPHQIVYVGRLHFKKGVDVLLNVMRQLIERRPQVRLVLVGGDLYYRHYRLQEEQLRRMAQDLGLQNHVEFVGMKPPHEVAQYVRESALLVLPSRSESFGATLVEALACGVPVVATRCGGPEDIVNDEVGVLVPKEDPDALVAGLEAVLDRRGEYAADKLRAYALENFSWERVAQQTVHLYRAAVQRFPSALYERQVAG
jgi:glycosyltransferase involved in cell wall biosynthesis